MQYLLIYITFILTLFLASCKTNPCKEVYCYNGGVCFDGVCRCPEGFSGDFCEIADTNASITHCNPIINCLPGTYEAVESCTFAGNKFYYLNISPSTQQTNYIVFSNLGGDLGPQIQGILNGLDISIPLQNNGNTTYQGYGSIDTTSTPIKLSLTYQIANDACSTELTKY